MFPTVKIIHDLQAIAIANEANSAIHINVLLIDVLFEFDASLASRVDQ